MQDTMQDFADLFLNGAPLLDVRAPIEFSRGAFPHTTNLPLLDDDQRHRIGICYKEKGQDAAIALGHQLVGGDLREMRTREWIHWVEQNPQGRLFCFRGGLRSQTVQAWLAARGVHIDLVPGGYKALRRYLIDQLENLSVHLPMNILCGRTGCGKTRVIEDISHSIDLEGAAHHRGSAFGRRPGGQPSQIDFENNVAIALLKHAVQKHGAVIVEDESKLIGRCALPAVLQERIGSAPRVIIEEDLESRVNVTLEDYVIAPLTEYAHYYGDEQAFEQLAQSLQDALSRIQRRLGGDRYKLLARALNDALHLQKNNGDAQQHRLWILPLLRDYYDPMYDYMLGRRSGEILFQGSREEVTSYLRARSL